jgi:serine protease
LATKPNRLESVMMRGALLTLAAACALLLATPFAQAQAAVADAQARVIVKYKVDSPLLRKDALSAGAQHVLQSQALGARVGLALGTGAGVADRTQVIVASGMTSEQLAQRLAAESDIEYAVPDQRRRHTAVPNDPLYLSGPAIAGSSGGPAVGQWYLRAPAGAVQSSINVEPAWDLSAGGSSIVVAIIDTGVRFDHSDLQRVAAGGTLLPGYDMISEVPRANDGDGRDADASDPGDWLTLADVTQPSSPYYQCDTAAQNSTWHGTQTSGLVAALANNGIGMAGVARNVRVLPVRALGKCGGWDSDIIAGMLWAAGLSVPGVPPNPNPARVLNLSLGGDGACTSVYIDAIAQINAAGAVVVVSAGNSSGHAAGTPANCPGVIAVAGLRHIGTKVSFSDLGPAISISAPGGNCVDIDAGAPCLYPILTTTNSGFTVPVPDTLQGSTYTDSFNVSLGTSFSAPLVAGTAALMLSVQPSLTPAQVRGLLQLTARPFPTTGSINSDGTPVPQCTAPQTVGTSQVDQLECYCTTSTCGAGMLDAGAAVLAASQGTAANFQGLWWNTQESGWGINFAHQGDTLFATWYTYNALGKPWWLIAVLRKSTEGVYSGPVSTVTGPPFNAVPFPPEGSPGGAIETVVGTMTGTFSDASHGTLAYTVNGTSQTKSIVPLEFGPRPVCTWGAQPNLALATNYQDLWWNTQESGWGINFTHQGDTLFATWYTYDTLGKPWWLIAVLRKSTGGVFAGPVSTVTGPPYNAVPFPSEGSPGGAIETVVGNATATFADGNDATFSYTVAGVSQSKLISRFVFAAPGTVCR